MNRYERPRGSIRSMHKRAAMLPPLSMLMPCLLYAADGTYSILSLPKAGYGEFILFMLLCGALVISAVLFEVCKVRRESEREKKAAELRFEENARRFGLDPEEREFLRKMAKHANSASANDLFESLPAFEQCVEGEVSEALSAAAGETAAQDLEDLLASIRKKLHYSVVEPGLPIVSTRNLSAGQSVWILGPRRAVNGEGTIALVRELFFTIKLSPKDSGGRPAFESPVRIALTRKADGIYGIEAPLVSFDPSNGAVKCRHTLKFKRNQLRRDVRVETDFSINLRCIAAGGGTSKDGSAFMVRMTDLSGGGLAFVSDRRLAAGDVVLITASSPQLHLTGVRAKIIALAQNRASQRILYHTQFVDIDFEKREYVIKFVFNRLRELNRR